MFVLTGKVMSFRSSRDSTRIYVEIADYDSIARYQVSIPATGEAVSLQPEQMIKIQITGARAFQSTVNFEGKILEATPAEVVKK